MRPVVAATSPNCSNTALLVSVISVGNGPAPTRVVYALVTPITLLIYRGGIPSPAEAADGIVVEPVTNGYVPQSVSKNVPMACSSKKFLPAFSPSCTNENNSLM